MSRAYLRRCVKKNDEMHRKEIGELRYENQILKATVRHYQYKARKVRRLANAAIERDDYLLEAGNANLDQEPPVILKGEIKSDHEDDAPCNEVKYKNSGYI